MYEANQTIQHYKNPIKRKLVYISDEEDTVYLKQSQYDIQKGIQQQQNSILQLIDKVPMLECNNYCYKLLQIRSALCPAVADNSNGLQAVYSMLKRQNTTLRIVCN